MTELVNCGESTSRSANLLYILVRNMYVQCTWQTAAAASGTHSSTLGASSGMKKRLGGGAGATGVVALVSDSEDEACK